MIQVPTVQTKERFPWAFQNEDNIILALIFRVIQSLSVVDPDILP
jgi:hypothetical protein